MSKELSTNGPSGLTLYAVLHDASDPTRVWRTDTHVYETASSANWASYRIDLTETDASGIYSADMPGQIAAAGTYPYDVRLLSGSADPADPIYAAGTVEWDGSAEATVSTSVTTRARVKVFNQWDDTTHDAFIDARLPSVTRAISKFLRRSVVAEDFDEVRNGRGTDWVRVYNPPVNDLTSITFDYNGQNPTTVTTASFVWDAETGVVKFKPTASIRYSFAEGFQNLRILYNGGWESVPEDVQDAAALIIRKLAEFGDDERLVTEKAEGSRKIKYDTVGGGISLDGPLFAEARELLLPYRLVRCG